MVERHRADAVRHRVARHRVTVVGGLVVLGLGAVPVDVQVVVHESGRAGGLVEDVLARHEQPSTAVEEAPPARVSYGAIGAG